MIFFYFRYADDDDAAAADRSPASAATSVSASDAERSRHEAVLPALGARTPASIDVGRRQRRANGVPITPLAATSSSLQTSRRRC